MITKRGDKEIKYPCRPFYLPLCSPVAPSPYLPVAPSPCPPSPLAAHLEHFDIAFQIVAPATSLGVVAAENPASVALLPVMATEAAAPSGLRGGVVLFD